MKRRFYWMGALVFGCGRAGYEVARVSFQTPHYVDLAVSLFVASVAVLALLIEELNP